ncbi:hypothetical protein BDV18DRAFT_155456 [Aspergillus unguis]
MYQVNWAILTPSVARTIRPDRVSCIKTMLLVGEAITRSEITMWQDAVDLYSLYGQSEHFTAIMLSRKSRAPGEDHPNMLGFPACGRGWAVDPTDHNRLVPIGVEGELLIEGPSLGRGYINDEETKAAFVTDPAWCQGPKNSRFLKTGDIVCYQPESGALQFRGRKAGKIKIRGQRIELGEVEFNLRQHFSCGESVFADLVQPVDNAQPILTAFIAPDPERETERETLDKKALLAPPSSIFRDQVSRVLMEMRRVLPAHMIPSAFITVEAMPRTATGKLDRRALREAASRLSRKELINYSMALEIVPPRGPTTDEERKLQSICAELLNLPPGTIGTQDNFFNLGGDSLSARQFVARARAQGLSISVADCFKQSTLRMLAARSLADQDKHDPIKDDDPFSSVREAFMKDIPSSLDPENIQDVLPAREAQFLFTNDTTMHYLFLHISEALDKDRLHLACQRLVDAHSTLRTVLLPFKKHEPWLQVILRKVKARFEVVAVPEHEEVDKFALSFCLEDQCIPRTTAQITVKFFFFDSQQGDHILAIRASHCLYDGLRLKPILESLRNLYTTPDSIPSQTTDYAAYTRKCAQLYTDRSIGFWRTFLAGSSVTHLPMTRFPCDPGEKQVWLSATREICLPTLPKQTETKTGAGITMATLIKAAWSYVLATETKSTDVLFGQIINCRSVDLPCPENIIGPCLNDSPVRVRYPPAGGWTVRDLLRHAQDQHAEIIEYETSQWRNIVRDCTDWAQGTGLRSFVLHQNFDKFPTVKGGKGQSVWRVGTPIYSVPAEPIIAVTTSPERREDEDILSVMLEVSNWVMRKEDSERLVDRLCGVLELFSRDYDALVNIS